MGTVGGGSYWEKSGKRKFWECQNIVVSCIILPKWNRWFLWHYCYTFEGGKKVSTNFYLGLSQVFSISSPCYSCKNKQKKSTNTRVKEHTNKSSSVQSAKKRGWGQTKVGITNKALLHHRSHRKKERKQIKPHDEHAKNKKSWSQKTKRWGDVKLANGENKSAGSVGMDHCIVRVGCWNVSDSKSLSGKKSEGEETAERGG